MLQQTQASRVVPFYRKWMQRYPTIDHLARAPLDDVIKTWEGLGYYSRARNLHKAANQMKDGIPSSSEALAKIQGLGPYTIGAIRAFAFKQKAAAVDANVLRVMARYYRITETIDSVAARKNIDQLAYDLLPDEEPWIITEALIELGALVCTKTPSCQDCPLQKSCMGKGEDLPKRKSKPKTTQLYRAVGVILSSDGVVLQQAEEGKVMAGLWEFPYVELSSKTYRLDEVTAELQDRLSTPLTYVRPLSPLTHTFTRYRAHLFPHMWQTRVKKGSVPIDALSTLPFSSGHRRIAQEVSMGYM